MGTTYGGDGGQEGREVTEGVVGLLHSLGLKKRTWRISKKLLHADRSSASHCISLSFTWQQSLMDSWASTQPVDGNEMHCGVQSLSRGAAQRRKEDR